MTQTIEAHMQQIKESKRTREDVIRESRGMLHKAFDQLEKNEQVIGDDIRNRTAEEMNLGKCPVCGGMLAIKHLRGNTQFIGCSHYPDCSFNIGLPMAQWGFAVRTDEVCDKHQLNFVRLVRKGARPWDIGCPLCHHISSNRESLSEIPSMTPALADNILAHHIYTVAELARSAPEDLAKRLGIPAADAGRLVTEAGTMLEKLRRRSECRKFLRDRLIPRRGRSYAKIMESLKGQGITELASLAHAEPAALKNAGIGDAEAGQVLADAKTVYYGQVLRGMGIPAVSLKKYLSAGFTTPDAFCELKPETLSERTGMSLGTVQKHVALVCKALNKSAPKKVSKIQTEKGRKELLTIKGLGEQAAEKLILAGVTDGKSLLAANPQMVAKDTSIPEQKIRDYQAIFRKKKDIIQL
jgi:DNA topoisomerase-1